MGGPGALASVFLQLNQTHSAPVLVHHKVDKGGQNGGGGTSARDALKVHSARGRLRPGACGARGRPGPIGCSARRSRALGAPRARRLPASAAARRPRPLQMPSQRRQRARAGAAGLGARSGRYERRRDAGDMQPRVPIWNYIGNVGLDQNAKCLISRDCTAWPIRVSYRPRSTIL